MYILHVQIYFPLSFSHTLLLMISIQYTDNVVYEKMMYNSSLCLLMSSIDMLYMRLCGMAIASVRVDLWFNM